MYIIEIFNFLQFHSCSCVEDTGATHGLIKSQISLCRLQTNVCNVSPHQITSGPSNQSTFDNVMQSYLFYTNR